MSDSQNEQNYKFMFPPNYGGHEVSVPHLGPHEVAWACYNVQTRTQHPYYDDKFPSSINMGSDFAIQHTKPENYFSTVIWCQQVTQNLQFYVVRATELLL